jgi:hypothetical protein
MNCGNAAQHYDITYIVRAHSVYGEFGNVFCCSAYVQMSMWLQHVAHAVDVVDLAATGAVTGGLQSQSPTSQ